MYKLLNWIPLDKINWEYLSKNRNDGAIELLKQNQDKIVWWVLSRNPNIFELDYHQMKKSHQNLTREIAEVVFHPRNILKWESL